VSLARNNRVLYRAQRPRDDHAAEPGAPVRALSAGRGRRSRPDRRERLLSDEAYRVWLSAAGRSQVSDDPGTVVALGFFSRYLPGVRQLFRSSALSSSLSIELSIDASGDPRGRAGPSTGCSSWSGQHYGQPAMTDSSTSGVAPGTMPATWRRSHQVWAVDSPAFAAAREAGRPTPRRRASSSSIRSSSPPDLRRPRARRCPTQLDLVAVSLLAVPDQPARAGAPGRTPALRPGGW